MINLNSKESYLSLIQQAHALEREVSLAEAGKPGIDFPEQLKTLSSLQQAVAARKVGGIPLPLQGIHRSLEGTLLNLSERVNAISLKGRDGFSFLQEAKWMRPNLTWMQIAAAATVAGAAAYCFANSTVASTPDLQSSLPNPSPQNTGSAPDVSNPEPPVPTPPAQDHGGVPQPFSGAPHVAEQKWGLCEAPQVWLNASALFESSLNQNRSKELNQRTFALKREEDLQASPDLGPAPAKIPQEEPPSNLEVSMVNKDPIESGTIERNLPGALEKTAEQISGHVLDTVLLGGLLLARHGINSAMPLLYLTGLNRGYHIVRLSGLSKGLKNQTTEVARWLEGAAEQFDRIESGMSISTSRMLESMTSIDRWAAIGLMDLVRSVPGIPGLSLIHPMGWRVIQFTPFLIAGIGKGTPFNHTIDNGTAGIAPIDEKTMGGYLKDLGYLGYIYVTGHALNVAAPLLYVAISSHVYQIVRLCNVTEQLKEKMPLLAGGLEETARTYSWIEERLPESTGKMVEGMTSMDSWAMVGLADLIQKVCKAFGCLPAGSPFLSYLIANDRGWSFTRYTPIFLGGALQVMGLGLNVQQRLLG